MGRSPAVDIALAHIEAWSHHDWNATRAMVAENVHALVTSTHPNFGGGDFTGAKEYMTRKTKGARLVEPGSAQVLSAIGDERSALVTATMRIALGPAGSMVTMARACLYLLDDEGKIKEERDQFCLLSE